MSTAPLNRSNPLRIYRKTKAGTRYAAHVSGPVTPELVQALDDVADAGLRHFARRTGKEEAHEPR
jgi:hypothetical protein